MEKILICDDDPLFHLSVKEVLKKEYQCFSAYHADEALLILNTNKISILLLDIQMRTESEGLDFLPQFIEKEADLGIIITSALSDFKTVKSALLLGANDYVPKSFDPNDLIHTVSSVLEQKKKSKLSKQKDKEILDFQKKHPIIGESALIVRLKEQIEKIKKSNANVVIYGETGVGKEAVARSLRKTLPDGSKEPFVAVDSATVLSTMAESVLFGHEKGAFTGADQRRKGLFEEASGGIIFFDEIANMPLSIQVKLLRVIQEKEVIPLGSTRAVPLEFRVVCASNQKLEERVSKGEFKEDLYQRLSVLPIDVPPLRDRIEDIPLLIKHFLSQNKVHTHTVTPEVIEVLKTYFWPGNVRELSNLISYVLTMSDSTEIDVSDLPEKYRNPIPDKIEASSFYDRVAQYEKEILLKELQSSNKNISQLAVKLKMDRSHLYSKLKLYKIHG